MALPPLPPDPEPGSDLDEAPTVSVAQLRAHREATGTTPPGSIVRSVRCPNGHLNPPHNDSCRVCGQLVIDRSIAMCPRPTLGQLRFEDGTTVRLDQHLVIGRKPPDDVLVEGVPARAVRIDDPDKVLSRVHLEVRLVDWQVQVVDRDSINHTFVELPGREPVQLRPAEPHPIPPGTRVSLGDSVICTFEASVP